jgi:hypothetical protein
MRSLSADYESNSAPTVQILAVFCALPILEKQKEKFPSGHPGGEKELILLRESPRTNLNPSG